MLRSIESSDNNESYDKIISACIDQIKEDMKGDNKVIAQMKDELISDFAKKMFE